MRRRGAHSSRVGGILRGVIKPPVTWCQLLEEEYRELYGAPPLDADAPPRGDDDDDRVRAVNARMHARRPSALCLSGGGIRSSTFALGVLQGLAAVGVLGK